MVAQNHEHAEHDCSFSWINMDFKRQRWGIAKISGFHRETEGFSPSQPTKAESGPFQGPWGSFSPSRTHVIAGVLLAKPHHLPACLPKEHLSKNFLNGLLSSCCFQDLGVSSLNSPPSYSLFICWNSFMCTAPCRCKKHWKPAPIWFSDGICILSPGGQIRLWACWMTGGVSSESI